MAENIKTRTKTCGKTIDDFRAAHDKNFIVPQKIAAGLEKLGKDSWEYESEFLKLCGVSTTDFARFRDEFEGHFLAVLGPNRNTKRVWASKALIAKMQEML